MGCKLPAFIREPGEVYRSRRNEYLTSHQLIDFAACPLLYKQKQSGLVAERIGEHYGVGAAAHTLILEGREVFEREYLVSSGPVNPKTGNPYGSDTKKFTQWADAQTKPVITDDQYALICQLAYSVKAHPVAKELLLEGVAEGVLRSNYCGIACQVRLDWYTTRFGVVDLKTCYDLDKFAAAYRREPVAGTEELPEWRQEPEYLSGYVNQLAFYRAIVADHTQEFAPVYLIAAEKREPYRTGVWLLDADDIYAAQRENEEQICRLIRCRKNNEWPTGYEELRRLKRKAA